VLLVLELSHVARSVARMKPFATVRWREANPEHACGPCQGPLTFGAASDRLTT
jgi:hypothetical protein